MNDPNETSSLLAGRVSLSVLRSKVERMPTDKTLAILMDVQMVIQCKINKFCFPWNNEIDIYGPVCKTAMYAHICLSSLAI